MPVTMKAREKSIGSLSRGSGSLSKKAVSLENSRKRPVAKRNLMKPTPPQGLRVNFKKAPEPPKSARDTELKVVENLNSQSFASRQSKQTEDEDEPTQTYASMIKNDHVSVEDQSVVVESPDRPMGQAAEFKEIIEAEDGVQQYTSEQLPHLHYFNQLQQNLLKQQDTLREAQKKRFFDEIEEAEKQE